MNIKDNVETFLEFPLLIVGFTCLSLGAMILPENFNIGMSLFLFSVAIILIEKLVERWDTKRKNN